MSDTVNEWVQFALRLPPMMASDLRKIASKNRNSMNTEIIDRLKESLRMYSKELSKEEAKESINEIIEEMRILSAKINSIFSSNPSLKEEFLSPEQKDLLHWFDNADPAERSLLLASLPELLSFLKKMR